MNLLAIAPIVFGILAVAARLAEHMVLEDIIKNDRRQLTPAGKVLVEALSVASQVMVVAGGVALGILWS